MMYDSHATISERHVAFYHSPLNCVAQASIGTDHSDARDTVIATIRHNESLNNDFELVVRLTLGKSAGCMHNNHVLFSTRQ